MILGDSAHTYKSRPARWFCVLFFTCRLVACSSWLLAFGSSLGAPAPGAPDCRMLTTDTGFSASTTPALPRSPPYWTLHFYHLNIRPLHPFYPACVFAHNFSEILVVIPGKYVDHFSFFSCARRPPNPVNILDAFFWNIIIIDVGHVRNIQSARCNISAH